MALSSAFIDNHVAHWTNELSSGSRPYRKHWPQCLFHHAPLESALAIIRDGKLRARNDPQRQHLHDVAAPGVIDSRADAHDRVRLYFRPRTPTQFHIEGIRKDGECKYGPGAHAPVLVMFVLDAKRILMLPDVMFSDRNMQSYGARFGDSEDFFGSIPFESVYHEGGTAGDNSIIAHRCAEILPTTPLPLEGFLKGIWFRSEPERDTFLHRLDIKRSPWEGLCQVSEELKVFDKRFAFLSEIGLSSEGVSFRINYRHDLKPINISIQVINRNGKLCADFNNPEFSTLNNSGGRWIFRTPLEPSSYLVRVKIEGHLAYESMIALENSLI